MTGDGVNDAPALKPRRCRRRDGHQGHRGEQGGGEMVLADDNFASIARQFARAGRLRQSPQGDRLDLADQWRRGVDHPWSPLPWG
jgi:hypothetical protein